MDLPPPAHLHLTTHLHLTILGWVALLTLLRLGVPLQAATTTIGLPVLLQEDITTHPAVLRLADLNLLRLPVPLQEDITTTHPAVLRLADLNLLRLPVALQEDITTTHPAVLHPAELILIQPTAIHQAGTITLQPQQQSTEEFQSLSR